MLLMPELVRGLREVDEKDKPAQQRVRAFSPLFKLLPDGEKASRLMYWWKDGDEYSLRCMIENGEELAVYARVAPNNEETNWFGKLPKHLCDQQIALHLPMQDDTGEKVAVFLLTHCSAKAAAPEDWEDCAFLLRQWLERRRAMKQAKAFKSFVDAIKDPDPQQMLAKVGAALEQFCGDGTECEFIPLHPLAQKLCANRAVEKSRGPGICRGKEHDFNITCVPIPLSNGGDKEFLGFRLKSNKKDFTLADQGICEAAMTLLSEALPNSLLRRRLLDLYSNDRQHSLEQIGPKLLIERDQEHKRYKEFIENFFEKKVNVIVKSNNGQSPLEQSWHWEEGQAAVQATDNMEFTVSFLAAPGCSAWIPEFERFALIALVSEIRLAILVRQNSSARIHEIREVRHAFRGGVSSAAGNLSAVIEHYRHSRAMYEKNDRFRKQIADDFFLSAEVKDQLANCEHALHEIDDFLDSSRILMSEMTSESLQKVPVNLVRILIDARRIYSHLAQTRGLKIVVTSTKDGVFDVAADRLLTKLCFSNILDNAIKYSWKNRIGVINIKVTQNQKGLVASVQNYGPVIDPDKRDRIFQPFVRIKEKGAQEMPGTGLGLAAVRKICELHGWQVEVHSDADSGTVFAIKIPNEKSNENTTP